MTDNNGKLSSGTGMYVRDPPTVKGESRAAGEQQRH